MIQCDQEMGRKMQVVGRREGSRAELAERRMTRWFRVKDATDTDAHLEAEHAGWDMTILVLSTLTEMTRTAEQPT